MRWFLPGDHARPAHLPPLAQSGEVSCIHGPTGAAGRVVGGVYVPGESGWVVVNGYWINAVGAKPQQLLRLDARDGIEVAGSEPEHIWLIPQILKAKAGGMVWSGEERLGPTGWAVPPPPEPWATLGMRLRDPLTDNDWERLGDDGVQDLALLAMAANYHITAPEIIAAQWLSRRMIHAVIGAVAGLEVR